MEHRVSSGPIAEVQAERGVSANAIPTELLMVEHRAVTPAPGQVGQSQAEILGYVFPQSVAPSCQSHPKLSLWQTKPSRS